MDCSSVVTDELIIRIKKNVCERHFIIVELHSVVQPTSCEISIFLNFASILTLITTKLWHVLRILCPERPPICRQTKWVFFTTDFSFLSHYLNLIYLSSVKFFLVFNKRIKLRTKYLSVLLMAPLV